MNLPTACRSSKSGSREWHPSGRPRRTYSLLFVWPWSYTGALSSGRGSMKMLPWTLVSVRNGRLWNAALKSPGLGRPGILLESRW